MNALKLTDDDLPLSSVTVSVPVKVPATVMISDKAVVDSDIALFVPSIVTASETNRQLTILDE